MAYFWDAINEVWIKKPPRRALRQRRSGRRILLGELLEEIRLGDSECKLYAGLLATKLTRGDADLMAEFGGRLAHRSL